jgi:hypothetical protein
VCSRCVRPGTQRLDKAVGKRPQNLPAVGQIPGRHRFSGGSEAHAGATQTQSSDFHGRDRLCAVKLIGVSALATETNSPLYLRSEDRVRLASLVGIAGRMLSIKKDLDVMCRMIGCQGFTTGCGHAT